jgi:hypothetical protein
MDIALMSFSMDEYCIPQVIPERPQHHAPSWYPRTTHQLGQLRSWYFSHHLENQASWLFNMLAAYLFAFATTALAANVCGVQGIHNANIDYYMGNFFYKGPGTWALCASYCKLDAARCKSFRYSYFSDAAAQYCEFFDSAL